MPNYTKEAIICFENASKAIMAEQALTGNSFTVWVMPTPSGIRGGCGFCLRFPPEDLKRAVAFLSEKGLAETEAYLREETGGHITYKRISLTCGGEDASGR